MLDIKSVMKKKMKWNGVRWAILNSLVWEGSLRKWHLSKDLKRAFSVIIWKNSETKEKRNTKVLQWELAKVASVAGA